EGARGLCVSRLLTTVRPENCGYAELIHLVVDSLHN
ncbi:MAG: hypothetical protein JWO91_3540, partial [Acidobacteriaceae bacterium]|nr:hypothetical protein [Acidobacteriaceae bacterium]